MTEQDSVLEKYWTRLFAGIFTLVIGFSAFLSTDSTVVFPRQIGEGDVLRVHILPVFQQAWPFFTKPPTDPEYIAYEISDRVVTKATSFPNSSSKNLFGLSRTQRAQGPEIANLIKQTAASDWTDCLTVADDCALEASKKKPITLENDSPFQTLCGELVLAETSPVPWNYRMDYLGWRVDDLTLFVDIRCDNPQEG